MTIKHKVFAAYSVLTASDVNTYLMNQDVVTVSTEAELSSVPSGVNVAFVVATGRLVSRNSAGAWPTGVTEVTYAAGWAGFTSAGAGWTGLNYWMRNGIVTLSGAFSTTAAAVAGATITTLPVGFRPPAQVTFTGFTLNPSGVLKTSSALPTATNSALTMTYGV